MGLGSMMAGGNPDPGRGRPALDFFPTPVEVTLALMRVYAPVLPKNAVVWEPCAGNGAMAWVMEQELGRGVVQSDLSPRKSSIARLDFLKADDVPGGRDDAPLVIITNPPFNLAEDMIRKAMTLRADFVAMVLKSSFWHAKSRQKLWREHKPTVIHPLTWRPDFMGLGRPTMEVMWCVWRTSNLDGSQASSLPQPTSYAPLNKPA